MRPNSWAVVQDGKVVNTVVWDGYSAWPTPEGCELVSLVGNEGVGVGWDYIDGIFVDNRESTEGTFDDVTTVLETA